MGIRCEHLFATSHVETRARCGDSGCEGGWNVRLDNRGKVLAIRPNGNVLRAASPLTAGEHDITDTNRAHGITIEPTTCIPQCHGDKLDLDHITTGLLCIDHPERILGTMN